MMDIPRDEMGNGFMRDTKDVMEETVEDLKRIEPGQAPPPSGLPQFFLIVSRKTKFMISQQLASAPAIDLDEILLSIYDFMDEQSELEEANIYLTKLKRDSILIETVGATVFAEAFSRNVDRAHYKEFHRAVKHLRKGFPQIGLWDGTPDGIPPGLRKALRQHFHAGPEPGGTPPSGEPAPLPPAPQHYEPDIQDCQRKMREWYHKGYKIDRLKEALHSDWATLVRTFDEYELDVGRLERFRDMIQGLVVPGFEEDLRKIRSMLSDPSKVNEIDEGLTTLARKVRDKLAIRLPVSDRRSLVEAIRGLPLGIPSSLWGIPLDTLVLEFLSAERGMAPDGSVLVKLRGVWYHADPRGERFLTPFSGVVQTRKDLFDTGGKADQLDTLLDEILEGK